MSQYQTAVQIISAHLNSLGIGASNFTGVANTFTDPKATNTDKGLAFAQLSLAIAALGPVSEGVSLGIGTAAAVVAAGSLVNNLSKIAESALTDGVIHQSDLHAAASDVTGLAGAIGLGLAPVAGSGGIGLLVGGALATAASIALSVEALRQKQLEDSGDFSNDWQTPEIKEMNDAVIDLMDDMGDAGKKLVDAMLDPAFWDAFEEQGAQIFEPLLDPLSDVNHWLRQNVPLLPEIEDAVRDSWNNSKNWVRRSDPLTLDLNGDSLSTIGVSTTNPILFDHNADGIKTGTGWVSADDAFLVRDMNGNGTIDSGRELFGDATLKSNGQLATNGFDALADLDSVSNGGNGDGIVNASDSHYVDLRLWRDLNQDGVSQRAELFTLASQNIIGINVASTANSQVLPNGNQLADIGTYFG
ncbi:MAG: hypothetical protein WBP13_05915 [Methylophilaceae bacterium]